MALSKPRQKPADQARKSHAGRWIDLWISAVLTAAVFAVYWQVRNFEFLNLDDPDSFQNPHLIHGFTREGLIWAFRSTTAANWYPLTWISHMLDLQLFGVQSGYHHLTNLLLHAISSVLLFLLLRRMTGARWPSAFVAFVFALHPLHVESVAWVAERKDVLSALFWILTMWAYLRFVECPGPLRYLITLAMFCCGLMSKAMLVTLPFALLLLDVWPLGRWKAGARRLMVEKLPMIALSIGVSLVTFYAQRRGGAVSSLTQLPLIGRMENAVVSYVAYLLQFLWPANLAIFYPYAVYSVPLIAVAGALLALITLLVVRADRHPYLAVGWFWYLGTLVPVIGLVQVGAQARADRYTYIPLIGISIMIAWGVAEFINRGKISKITVGIFAAIICAAWLVVTWNQLRYWQNSVGLFEHAIQVTANNTLAYNNLGEVQLRQGHLEQAVSNLNEAVRLDPDSAKTRLNLATALNLSGRTTEAEAQYRLALHYDPASPEAHGGLGVVLQEQGNFQGALAELQESVRLMPDDAAGHYNLGRLFSRLGRNREALAQYAEAVRLQPSSVDAHISLGAAYATENKLAEALAEFQTAERLDPASAGAHFSAGTALANLGRYDQAIQEFTETLRLNPDLAAAKQSLEYYSSLRSKSARPR